MTQSSSWFVSGDTKRIDLPNGWIEVRKEISIGTQRGAFASSIKGTVATPEGTRTDYDAQRMSFGMVLAYLVDWSAVGADGKPVRIDTDEKKRSAVENLKPALYKVIEDAINKHANEVAAEKKETGDGAKNSEATSQSAA